MHAGFHSSLRTSDDFSDFGNRHVLKEMKNKNLAMVETHLTQCKVNRRPVFMGKRWLFRFLKIFEFDLLCTFSR